MEEKLDSYKLSPQFIGCVMMALQKCLQEQSDITKIFESWDVAVLDDELVVTNFIGVRATPLPVT